MKIAVFSKKQAVLWVLVAVWLVILLAVILFTTVVEPVGASKRRLPVYSVEHTDKKIALTFDCAWGDETTDAVLEILKQHNVTATFFFRGHVCRAISRFGAEDRQRRARDRQPLHVA